MAQVSITCLWIILHALQKIVFVVNYIEIDPHHRHKYFTCWGHSLNWQNLCSLWHLNLSQNSRVYLTLFVWHLSLLTLTWFDLILVVAFEFANKSSIRFIQCHSYVVNSMRIMRIKFPFNYKLFRYLRWDYYFFYGCHEYICSVYASQNTLWKFGFHLCIFSTGSEQCVISFHFSNVEECLNSRRLVKKLCQNQRYVKMCWNSLLKNVSIKLGEFFSLKAREFFQNILFGFFGCQIFAKFTAK